MPIKKKEKKKYFVGKQEVTREEYLSAKGKLGFRRQTGQPPLLERPPLTPRVEEAIAEGFKPRVEKAKELLIEKGLKEERVPKEEITEVPPEIIEPEIVAAKVPITEEPIPVEEEQIGIVRGYKDVQQMIKEGKVVTGAVPIGGIPIGGAVIAANAAKAKIGILTAAKAKIGLSAAIKWAGVLFGVKTIADVPEKKMQDVLAELRIMKTSGRRYMRQMQLGPDAALDVIDALSARTETYNVYEEAIQKHQSKSYQGRLLGWGKFGETQMFIEEMRAYDRTIAELAARVAVGGEVSPEEVALVLQEMEEET